MKYLKRNLRKSNDAMAYLLLSSYNKKHSKYKKKPASPAHKQKPYK